MRQQLWTCHRIGQSWIVLGIAPDTRGGGSTTQDGRILLGGGEIRRVVKGTKGHKKRVRQASNRMARITAMVKELVSRSGIPRADDVLDLIDASRSPLMAGPPEFGTAPVPGAGGRAISNAKSVIRSLQVATICQYETTGLFISQFFSASDLAEASLSPGSVSSTISLVLPSALNRKRLGQPDYPVVALAFSIVAFIPTDTERTRNIPTALAICQARSTRPG